MNHADVRSQMPDYLEGDLPLGQRALFDAHLDECQACAEEVGGMRDTIALLRSLPEPAAPDGFSAQVMRRVRAREDRPDLLESLRNAVETLLSPNVLAPISVALLATGILIGTGGVRIVIGDEPRVVPTDAQVARQAPPAMQRQLGASTARSGQSRGSVGDGQTSIVAIRQGASGMSVPPSYVDLQQLGRNGGSMTLPVSESTGLPGGFGGDPFGGSNILAVAPRTPVQIADASSGRSLPSADDWLAHLERNPADFADRLAALSLAEHELWVGSLARHAAAQGRLDAVIASLETSASRRARLLAEDFAAVGAGAASLH